MSPVTRPKLLDLYCCQGGAARGYDLAGFDVYGMDNVAQPRYPYPFRQADVLELKAKWIRKRFDAVHASPPCQFHTRLKSTYLPGHGHVNLIPQTRKLLNKTGLPFVIENVMGAKDHMVDPVMLCGTEFFLGATCRDGMWRELRRHRLFESNIQLERKSECYHDAEGVIGVYGGPGALGTSRGYKGLVSERIDAMEIDWMNNKGLAQALPPAYTEHLGKQLIQYV